jgi:acetyl-CoA carboxylase carboxyl transferase subunit beta
MAGEIARCLADLTASPVPTVSILAGMGCGGAALAMMPADVVIAAECAWVSPLPLEGASIIRHRTPDNAPQMARDQRVAAWQLAQDGIVDLIVDEMGNAADHPRWFAEQVAAVVHDQLLELLAEVPNDRLSRRRTRYHGGLNGN